MKIAFYALAAVLLLSIQPRSSAQDRKFDFGPGQVAPGFVQVTSSSVYKPGAGYGFIDTSRISDVNRKTPDVLLGDFCTSDSAFIFAVELPEGNYDVKVSFGDPAEPANTVIKAEARRLMLAPTATNGGQSKSVTFTVNVRRPAMKKGESVHINKREQGPPMKATWDDLLTLEFNGTRPCISAVEITEAKNAITVFLAGDSTVTDQDAEPWCGWGQILPVFFQPGVAIANHAESGLALYSFESQKRLEKILETMKKGDYLFIQFGHNDQKDKKTGAGPFTSYKENLKSYVGQAREKGGIPVLVTPMERRRWEGNEPKRTLTDYAEAVRQVGTEDKLPVIDLNAMSVDLYRALGPEKSKQVFVYFPAGTVPGQTADLKDDTHHSVYGGYELARCIVNGIREKVPALAAHLRPEAGTLDPTHPDSPEAVAIPLSPTKTAEKPAGN